MINYHYADVVIIVLKRDNKQATEVQLYLL